MSETESSAPERKKRFFAAARIAIIHAVCAAAVIRIYVGVRPFMQERGDGGGFDWLGALAAASLAVVIVSALVLCDDFALQRRFFDSFGGEKKTARYAVNAICRVVCALYCAACVAALCVGTIYLGPFLLAAYHVVDTFLVLIAALRLADLILWLYERKKKDVRY